MTLKQLKRFIILGLAGLLLAAMPAVVSAQAIVQQSATRLDATTNFSGSQTSAATITISPPAGQFVYVTGVDIANCAGTTVTAATPLTITTTGLGGGTTPVYLVGTTGTAGMCNPGPAPLVTPIKSNTPGANITFVLPTFTTQQTVRANIWYYFGL